MDLSNLCVNCFKEKGTGEYCTHCGYNEGASAENELHLAPGTVLKGQYLVGRVLGYGGFGVTYLAYDLNLQQVRAIKEYLPGELSTRATDGATVYSYSGEAAENYAYGLEKFIEEGSVLAKFANLDAIVSVYDYFRENNTAYLVMEYLDGMDLSAYLRQKGGRISWNEAKTIFAPVMHALAKVHVTGLIRRDIAPDNIYVTNDGRVKLLDFGAARQAIGEKSQSLSVILKPGYAPPEQYHSRGAQGPWTDVYALGATIYRALSGITPTESLTRVMNDDLKPLSELGISVPQGAEMALGQSLNLDENARFKDMDAFYSSLFEGAQAPRVKQRAALIGGGESFSQKVKTTIFKPLVIKVTAVVLSVAMICTLLFAVVLPLINYNTAVTLFKAGQYGDAGDTFRNLGSYKESIMYLARSLYKEGEQDYETGSFIDALDPFEELSGYYSELEDLVTDAQYMDGVSRGVDGDFEDAIDALEGVGDYKNALELIAAAENGDAQPFIDEALEHELPVTEEEVIETVAEHENYDNDVVQEHISDAQADEESTPVTDVESQPAESQTYDYSWITQAAAKAKGYESFEAYKAAHGYVDDPYSVMLRFGKLNYNEGGKRQDNIVQEIDMNIGIDDVVIELMDDELDALMPMFNKVFPIDYFAKLPAGYSMQSVEYKITEDSGDVLIPVYSVISQECAIYSEESLKNFAQVIDLDTLIQKDIEDYASAYISGYYQDGQVAIECQFSPSDVYTTVTYMPDTSDAEGSIDMEDVSDGDELTRGQYVTLDAGFYHTVVIRTDGTVVATGNNHNSQCDVDSWTDIVSVSAGDEHTVGLTSGGTVVASGWNYYGQCDVAGWADIVAVSAGEGFSVGLKSDGTVVAVGNKSKGQCDVGDWTDIVEVSAGTYHTVGLKSDGTVVAAGSNYDDAVGDYIGECEVGGWTNIVAVSAATNHTVGLKSDGTVVAAGDNYGQCDVDDWTNIVAVSASYNHTVGLKSDGTVIVAGQNDWGQCDLDGWDNIVAVSAGQDHTVGLKSDGTVIAVGSNQLFTGEVVNQCDVKSWTDIMLPGQKIVKAIEPEEPPESIGLVGPVWVYSLAVQNGFDSVRTIEFFDDGTAVVRDVDMDNYLNGTLISSEEYEYTWKLEGEYGTLRSADSFVEIEFKDGGLSLWYEGGDGDTYVPYE